MQAKLFTNSAQPPAPLAARMRPRSLREFTGQAELVQKLSGARLHSMLFYGPPGCGKTSLATLLAQEAGLPFFALSAVSAGVKEIRLTIEKGKRSFLDQAGPAVLFLDEIHRFSRSQQDSLLGAVEAGWLILIGATTEHPAFEVTAPLLSRLKVYRLQALSSEELSTILQRALQNIPAAQAFSLETEAQELLLEAAGGDARRLLGNLELAGQFAHSRSTGSPSAKFCVTVELVRQMLSGEVRQYDKSGQYHYDYISAFIKSLRGSDPDAALLYMACMLEGGEDPLFIARRMLIFAAEDIGNAYPAALNLATSAFLALERIGLPEGRIILGQVATLLASCPKSNAACLAIDRALAAVQNRSVSVPRHLANAPTKLHRILEGRAKDYRYPHDFAQHFVEENYFPQDFSDSQYYFPTCQGQEERFKERLKGLWPRRKYE